MITISLLEPSYVEIYQKIRKLFFKKQGYENILSFMIQQHLVETKEHDLYLKEYIDIVTDYEICKEEFEQVLTKNLNYKTSFKWNIDFIEEVVQIE